MAWPGIRQTLYTFTHPKYYVVIMAYILFFCTYIYSFACVSLIYTLTYTVHAFWLHHYQ